MVNRDRVQVYRIHEAQNCQQGRVRTRAVAAVVAAVHVNPFVQHADTSIASAPRNQHWQSQDKDDDQDGARIFHVACPEKDMPVFVNAITFTVAVSEIATVGTDVNGMPQLHELPPPFLKTA